MRQFAIRSVNQSEPIYYDPKLPIAKIVMGSQVCDANLSIHDLDFLLQLYSYVRFPCPVPLAWC